MTMEAWTERHIPQSSIRLTHTRVTCNKPHEQKRNKTTRGMPHRISEMGEQKAESYRSMQEICISKKGTTNTCRQSDKQ